MQWWLEFAAACAYGILSSVIPVFNAEAFILATQGFGLGRVASVIAGMAIGSAVGKDVVIWLLRTGRQLPWRGRDSAQADERHARRSRPRWDAVAAWWSRWSARLLALMERPGWAIPITVLSAAIGLPPYYAVTLVAAAGRTGRLWFFIAGAIGSALRFGLLTAATLGLLSLR